MLLARSGSLRCCIAPPKTTSIHPVIHFLSSLNKEQSGKIMFLFDAIKIHTQSVVFIIYFFVVENVYAFMNSFRYATFLTEYLWYRIISNIFMPFSLFSYTKILWYLHIIFLLFGSVLPFSSYLAVMFYNVLFCININF